MRIKTLISIGIILLCTSICTPAALDLRFTTAITQAPDPASTGSTVTFTVTFKTFGGAVDNLKITGGIDSSKIFERTYAHVNADLQRTDSFTWVAAAGSHTAWFELDPGHTVGDSNYGNNRIEKAFTVSGTPVTITKLPEKIVITSPPPAIIKPDLIIQSLEIIPATPHVSDTAMMRVIIKNIGTSEAPKNKLITRICFGTDGFGDTVGGGYWDEIPILSPGATYEVTDTGQWFKTNGAGTYWMRAKIDRSLQVDEIIETNNAKEITFTVVP
jgi:hypothetical protein